MPYVQYGGWCSCSIALEPGCSKFRGEITSLSSNVLSGCRISRSPTRFYVGGFPFYSSRWGPLFTYIYRGVLVPPGSSLFSLVVGAHSVSREWGNLSLASFLAQWVVWVVLSHPWSVGMTSPLGRSLGGCLLSYPPVPMPLIRSASTRPPLRSFCLKDSTPGEGCPAIVRRCRPVTPTGVME